MIRTIVKIYAREDSADEFAPVLSVRSVETDEESALLIDFMSYLF